MEFDLQLFADEPEEKKYDQAYVTRLKNEAAEARKAHDELVKASDALAKERDELAKFKADQEKAELEKKGEYEKALAKIEADRKAEAKKFADDIAARDRLHILGEAKAEAIKLGIIDGLESKIGALAELNDLTIGEDGTIAGLSDRIVALKEANPSWFKGEGKPRAGASPGGSGSGDTVTDWLKLSADQVDEKLNGMLRV